ncbi:MAG: polyprenyl synthetase family protein [Hyphomonadaceae bacterium]|nr:polyprenyl synthetase family protein [Hyphomonadaceae bacterium]
MTDLKSRLSASADRVNIALDALLPPAQGPEERLMRAMRYSALDGGKRLRPFFTLEAGALFDADESVLLRAAVAIECVHTYSLIHDDLPCMDDDDLRRGRPTLHKAFDEATAVLAGDALLTFAFEMLADPATHPDPQMRCLLIAGLAKASGPLGMVAGQAADMAGGGIGSDLIAVTRMNRLKTGALINFSVDAGALIGCAREDQRAALNRYAHDVGLAFQMVDDLLDAEGVVRDTGKAVGKDKARGKVNFVTVLGIEATRERVGMLAAQAKHHLSGFGPRAQTLREVVDFIIERRY